MKQPVCKRMPIANKLSSGSGSHINTEFGECKFCNTCSLMWFHLMLQLAASADMSSQDTIAVGTGLRYITVGRFMVLWAVVQKLRIHLAWDALVLSFSLTGSTSFILTGSVHFAIVVGFLSAASVISSHIHTYIHTLYTFEPEKKNLTRSGSCSRSTSSCKRSRCASTTCRNCRRRCVVHPRHLYYPYIQVYICKYKIYIYVCVRKAVENKQTKVYIYS